MDKARSQAALEKIRQRMYEPTSRKDIQYMLNGKVRVIEYTDLGSFSTLEELLEPYMSVVILYPNPPPDNEVGHWCCLFTNTGTERLEFFDSYGAYVDEKIGEYDDVLEVSKDLMHTPRKIEPRLLDLILESRYADNVHWNDTEYQSSTIATNTCGLWCVARLKNKHLNEYEFKKIYLDIPISRNILPDSLVSEVILELHSEMGAQV